MSGDKAVWGADQCGLYAPLPLAILSRRDLNARAKIMAAVLFDLSRQRGFCWAGLAALVRASGQTKHAVIDGNRELKEMGLLVVERGKNGRGRSNRYYLDCEKIKALISAESAPFKGSADSAQQSEKGCHSGTHGSAESAQEGCQNVTGSSADSSPKIEEREKNSEEGERGAAAPCPAHAGGGASHGDDGSDDLPAPQCHKQSTPCYPRGKPSLWRSKGPRQGRSTRRSVAPPSKIRIARTV